MRTDDRGWALDFIDPLPPERAFSLLSPSPEARVDVARWAQQARTFFASTLEARPPKRYPGDATPSEDAVEIEITPRGGSASRVRVVTLPVARAPDVLAAADRGVVAIGGAGFDALVARAVRVWQVEDAVVEGGDPRAPLAVAAVLASVLLAPIVPPLERTVFGVKGARERLESLGWGR